MKTLGILLIGSTMFLAGCACDCDEKLKAAALANDTTGGAVGTYYSPDGTTDNNGNAGTQEGSGQDAYTGSGATGSGAEKDKGATMHYEANTPGNTPNVAPTKGREYEETSTGGVGYRTDTVKKDKGLDGSARDKTPK